MHKILVVCVATLCLATSSFAHSWIHCTDYRIQSTEDSHYYDASKCKAYPRRFDVTSGAAFGEDRGYNFQGDADNTCNHDVTAPNYDSAYTTAFPMAKYLPGQTICLAWPSKNHVAATCTNEFIPDTALAVYRSGPNPTAELSQAQWKQNPVKVWEGEEAHQNGVIDFKGFQNCPKFCENEDKSMCSQCFQLPSDLEKGKVYSFQWYWVFNAGDKPYTSCWDAMIVSSKDDLVDPDSVVGTSSGGGGMSNGAKAGIAILVIFLVVAIATVGALFYIKTQKPVMWMALKTKARMTLNKV